MVHAKYRFLWFVVSVTTFMCLSIYCNLDLDDQIYNCLLTLVAAVQTEDVPASLLFVGDLNGYHQEWQSEVESTLARRL